MENASKALIIAGAILISILLISVAILIFNSASGTANNSKNAGDTMESAAAIEKSKIVLSTMDIEKDAVFNGYIREKYVGRNLTAVEVRELCTLIIERTKELTGSEYDSNETHITSQSTYEEKESVVYHNYNGRIFL